MNIISNCKKLFEYRICTMKFKKSRQNRKCIHILFDDSWEEVTDGYLMGILLDLQKYCNCNFEILSTKFKDSYSYSYIKIKCKKKDKVKIFGTYCNVLTGKIDSISF